MVTDGVVPRFERAETIGVDDIVARLEHLASLHRGVVEEIEANEREHRALLDREHQIRSEFERLDWKLTALVPLEDDEAAQ